MKASGTAHPSAAQTNPRRPTGKHQRDSEIKQILERSAELAEEHVRGNKALYERLEKIHSLAVEVKSSTYCDEIVAALRRRLKEVDGIKTTKRTPFETLIVKSVVKTDRQSAHNYSKAIRAAIDSNVIAGGFAAFVAERKGLGELGRKKGSISAKREELQRRANILRTAMVRAARKSKHVITFDVGVHQYRIAAAAIDKTESAKDMGDFALFVTWHKPGTDDYYVAEAMDLGAPFEDVLLRHVAERSGLSDAQWAALEAANVKSMDVRRTVVKLAPPDVGNELPHAQVEAVPQPA